MRSLKVWIGVSIVIDVDALEAEYGRTFTAAEARADVKDSVLSVVIGKRYRSGSGPTMTEPARVPGILTQVLYPERSNIVLDVKETK